jgi:hypothetical protein
LDTRNFEIDLPDGRSDEYTANVIAENMYAPCDIEGRQYNLVEIFLITELMSMLLSLLICTSIMEAIRK